MSVRNTTWVCAAKYCDSDTHFAHHSSTGRFRNAAAWFCLLPVIPKQLPKELMQMMYARIVQQSYLPPRCRGVWSLLIVCRGIVAVKFSGMH